MWQSSVLFTKYFQLSAFWQHGRVALPGFLIVGWDYVTGSGQSVVNTGCMWKFISRPENLISTGTHSLWHGGLVNA